MKCARFTGAALAAWCVATTVFADAKPAAAPEDEQELPGIGEPAQAGAAEIADPLEPMNRAFFQFNDKLYLWLLKPVATGYGTVVPQTARVWVKNFFSHIATPVRVVNCALQGEFKGAMLEVQRFAINTTVGIAGFGDPAKNLYHVDKRDEDFGQTLGFYGVGTSVFLNWPVLGPSNVRDTVGYVGDRFLDPTLYAVPRFEYSFALKAFDTVNGTSLRGNDYEEFKKASLDPYVAMRDAYTQYRRHLVSNAEEAGAKPAGPMPPQ